MTSGEKHLEAIWDHSSGPVVGDFFSFSFFLFLELMHFCRYVFQCQFAITDGENLGRYRDLQRDEEQYASWLMDAAGSKQVLLGWLAGK